MECVTNVMRLNSEVPAGDAGGEGVEVQHAPDQEGVVALRPSVFSLVVFIGNANRRHESHQSQNGKIRIRVLLRLTEGNEPNKKKSVTRCAHLSLSRTV